MSDPATWKLVADIAVAAGGTATVVSAVTAKDPKERKPVEYDREEERRRALAAQKRKRKQALGAYGSSDTNITGGLGSVPAAYTGSKTLLGA